MRDEHMSDREIEKVLPAAAETTALLQTVNPGVIDQEGASPRGVKRPVEEEWPTSHECSQHVTTEPVEDNGEGQREEYSVDTHPFLSLLIQVGYTKWWWAAAQLADYQLKG